MRQAGRAHPATTPKPIDEKPGRAASSSHPGGFTKFPSWEVDGLELEAFGRLGWGEGREGGSSLESWRGSHRTRAQPPGWSLTTRRLQSTRLAWLCTIAQQQAASLPRRSPWVQWLNAPQPGASPPRYAYTCTLVAPCRHWAFYGFQTSFQNTSPSVSMPQ